MTPHGLRDQTTATTTRVISNLSQSSVMGMGSHSHAHFFLGVDCMLLKKDKPCGNRWTKGPTQKSMAMQFGVSDTRVNQIKREMVG